jgi:hypothetical protein
VFFLPNFAVFDIVWKNNSQKIKVWKFKEVIEGSWSYLIVVELQKLAIPHSMGSKRL